jgi:AcrR family transcriptional regulator
MKTATQARTLKTRARLIEAAQQVIADSGYSETRVEEIVRRAGVAKGTFFAHFRDKDALMDQLIGARIDALLDGMEARQAPDTVEALIDALTPLMQLMTCERYVFDVIIRHSGAAAKEEIGPIAMTFGRFIDVVSRWMLAENIRKDAASEILAEGVQAFMVNAMALNFCALHNDSTVEDRLRPYLELWLFPQGKD